MVWKSDEKNGVTCLVFMPPSKVMFLKLSKIVSFLEFFANVSKKSKTDLVTYVCGSKRSHFSLLENGILYYDFT